MGKTEERLRDRQRLGKFERLILSATAGAGILAVGLIAPNALQLLKYLPGDKNKFAYRTKTTTGRLVQKGYLMFIEKNGTKYARLTPRGEKELEIATSFEALKPKRKWDGKWRMVLFDIPEKRRVVRTRLRSVMKMAGFLRLQNSAWIYPYDCEDLITLVKAELKIGSAVIYAVVDSFMDERDMRKHFKLPAI